MEARFGGKTNVNGPVVADMKALGKRTLEWDLNDWKWDSDLFLASPLNHEPSDCRSRQFLPIGPEKAGYVNVSESLSSCFKETSPTCEQGKRELDKRRRSEVVPQEVVTNYEAGSLNLKLGEQVYPITEGDDSMEGKSGKKSKFAGSARNYPVCQVKDCRADLSNAKDYHRRHKVCQVHSKASEALVGNVMQRFCQQCSRFHVLQEFDEGKRSCRRRLAGHNKRRRKTHPETSVNVGSLANEKSAGYLLISLLRVLTNLHTNGSDQSQDQDLLSHLLRNLAGPVNGSNISELMKGSQSLLTVGTSAGIAEKDLSSVGEQYQSVPSTEAQRGLQFRENKPGIQQTASVAQSRALCPTSNSLPLKGTVQEANFQRCMPCGIDLNNVYDDSEDCVGDWEKGHASVPCSFWAEQEMQKSSPPPTSGNSDSTYGQSSSSGNEAQCCTDRIVFKLFGKDPNDLPHSLRTQILDWLSHSPTDIEGYIRPGCIVLTIYLRLTETLWDELCCGMSSRLSMLLDTSNDPFWKTGWIYTRVRQQAAFICDGQVVLDSPLPFKNSRSQILSISPLAVPTAETVQWVVRGSNLTQPTSRLLCAIEGRYLVQEGCYRVVEGVDTATEQDEIQSLSFCCSTPDVSGRGFIEVEDYGLTGCFFPFIVAEPEICSEICMLEKVMEMIITDDGIDGRCGKIEARNQALDFIHEMGWLLHRNRLRLKPGQTNPNLDLFPFGRLKWLVEFSMDHDWCAVLRKLLDLVFSGIVDSGEYASVEQAILEMGLLHDAVRKDSRPMVELLLMYVPQVVKDTSDQEQEQLVYRPPNSFFFRPDVAGADGLTPLHIAASTEGSENVLEALLEDPGSVGIEAWRNARDSTGMTPSDYASLRGHYSYINMVQQKINNKSSCKHVVVDIPSSSNLKSNQNQTNKPKSGTKVDSMYTEKFQLHPSCRLCKLKPDYGFRRASFTYKPAVLSLLAIAVVCVCAALLFKSLPHVGYVFEPFKWETVKYGSI